MIFIIYKFGAYLDGYIVMNLQLSFTLQYNIIFRNASIVFHLNAMFKGCLADNWDATELFPFNNNIKTKKKLSSGGSFDIYLLFQSQNNSDQNRDKNNPSFFVRCLISKLSLARTHFWIQWMTAIHFSIYFPILFSLTI